MDKEEEPMKKSTKLIILAFIFAVLTVVYVYVGERFQKNANAKAANADTYIMNGTHIKIG